MLVKDAMVLIHLAKMTLLEPSCQAFEPVLIPSKVRDEVAAGRERGYPDATIVHDVIEAGRLEVKGLKNEEDLEQLARLNVTAGEAEAVALCWQEGIERLATDDDNVRNKQALLNIACVGTPAILLTLYRQGEVSLEKLEQATATLDRVGWFSRPVLDKVLMEAHRWAAR